MQCGEAVRKGVFKMKKKRARRKFSTKRDNLSPETRRLAEEKIEENLFSLKGFTDAENYFVYLGVGGEVPTANIISRLLNLGKNIYVPKISGEDMLAVRAGAKMKNNRFGIPEPEGTEEAARIDVCITPLVAADCALNRIGRGKGYYDRFFAAHPCVKIGVCYAAQVYKKTFDTEAGDVPLDFLVTEKGTEKRVENV